MRGFATSLALALLACPAMPVSGQVSGAESIEAIGLAEARERIRTAMAHDGIPAMAVAVYHDGELVWDEAFGFANVELQAPATTETLFRIGSVSKLFAGTIAARLADRGAIDLDLPVGEYVPEWPRDKPPMTLRQLLGHLAGIRHYTLDELNPLDGNGGIDFALYPDHAAILAIFADDPLLSEPGAEFHYSSFGFSLAQVALEAATGKTYLRLLEDEVLEPGQIAGIRGDCFLCIVPNRTGFYDKLGSLIAGPSQDGEELVVSLPLNSAYKFAGGGLLATARGLAGYGRLHMAAGFLSENAYRALMTPQHDAAGEQTQVGLAWGGRTDPFGRYAIGHAGSQQGGRGSLALYPADGYVVALVSNLGGYPTDVVGLSGAIVDLLEGGDGVAPTKERE